MKNIILHLDNAFFNKLKANKIEIQGQMGKEITWEMYIALLFGKHWKLTK
jgi:hypothetical protein